MERIDAHLAGQVWDSTFQIDGQSAPIYYFAAVGDPATGESRILLGTEAGLYELTGTVTVQIETATPHAWTGEEAGDFQDARRFTEDHWRALAALIHSIHSEQAQRELARLLRNRSDAPG